MFFYKKNQKVILLKKQQIKPTLQYKCHIVFASEGQNVDREYFGICLRILLVNNNKKVHMQMLKNIQDRVVIACFHKGVKKAITMYISS